MYAVEIENVKKGEFIRRKPDAKKTYVRGDYDRIEKKYILDDWDDTSRWIYIRRGTVVYTGFTF